MTTAYVFTSESVTAGHPDKLCDQISDSLVDRYLLQDPLAQVTAECAVSTGILFASVKVASTAVVDIPNAAREVILDVGYDHGNFSGRNCTIMTNLSESTPSYPRVDEAAFDDDALEQLAAQDNVTLFGYACNQTAAFLPLPIWLSHRLVQQLDVVRSKQLSYLAADSKCQVGIVFHDRTPHRVDSVTLVVSQKREGITMAQLQRDLLEQVIHPVFAEEGIGLDDETRININPEGMILEGGPAVHAGLTGRKNSDDTYGGFSRHSSAGLSGKDPSRIDRIGAYAARHAAKNIVAAGLAEECEVQLSYSIGRTQPVGLRIETFGTGRLDDEALRNRVAEIFDFRPGGIIRRFRLRTLPQEYHGSFYRQLAVYGHMGRLDLATPWEATDATAELCN